MPFYTTYAGRNVSFVGKYLNRRLAGFIIKTVSRWCRPGDTITEIGPGDGRVARGLAGQYRYTGYEPAPALAQKLRASNIAVNESFVPPLLEADGSQAAVVASHVLEHQTDYRAAFSFCEELYRVCKPGGVAVIVCPDARGMGMLFFDVDYTHGFITTPARTIQLLKDCGFTVMQRGIIYGALPALPGVVLYWMVRVLFFAIGFIARHRCRERTGLFKAENLFSPAFWIVAQKPR